MKNDWFVSEETEGSNPDIFVESKDYGTICQITGGTLAHRRKRAKLIAKAPALESACKKAVAWLEREGNQIQIGAGVDDVWDILNEVRAAMKGDQ